MQVNSNLECLFSFCRFCLWFIPKLICDIYLEKGDLHQFSPNRTAYHMTATADQPPHLTALCKPRPSSRKMMYTISSLPTKVKINDKSIFHSTAFCLAEIPSKSSDDVGSCQHVASNRKSRNIWGYWKRICRQDPPTQRVFHSMKVLHQVTELELLREK